MQILAALKVTIRIEVNSESLIVKYPIAQTIFFQAKQSYKWAAKWKPQHVDLSLGVCGIRVASNMAQNCAF